MRNITDEFLKILIDQIGQVIEGAESTTLSTRFREDLGLDSLDEIELVMDVEHHFEISIADEEAVKLLTVGAAVDFIEKKLGF